MFAYRKVEDELSAYLKTTIPSCIPKNELKLCIYIWRPIHDLASSS